MREIFFSGLLIILIFIACESKDKLEAKYIHHFTVDVNTTNPIGGDINMPTYYKDQGVLMLPESYFQENLPVKLIVYCHSGGGTVTSSSSEVERSNLCKYLVSLGYAVMDMAGMPVEISNSLVIDHNRNIGSYIAVESYSNGIDYVLNNYNIDSTSFSLLANSNGGLTALNMINLTSYRFNALVGIAPLLSIERNAWNMKSVTLSGGGFEALQGRANVIRLYDMAPFTTQEELDNAVYEKQKVQKYDPFNYLFNSENVDFSVPFLLFQSKDDPIVKWEIANELVNHLNKQKDIVNLRSFETGGHNSTFNNTTIGMAKYFSQQIEVTENYLEVAKWFKLHKEK